MASTSTSASTSISANSNHDVFISHRGVDVKKTLASHLYQRLLSHGIRAFLDQDELVQGDDLTSQIECAISSASIHVAIFSTRYADSAWCLKELVLMQESNSPIIPVFYGVEPAEVRWIKGTYAQNLEKLKSRYDITTVEKWRKALASVPDKSGFELKAYNGDEGKLLRDLVEQIVKRVKTPALLFEVAKYPIGLDDKVNDFENTVLLQGKPQILGIVGLGGVGKTTLAKELFNRKNSEYSKSCILSDVRDNAGKDCLISLQKSLLKALNVPYNIIERVNGVDQGKGILRKYLSSVKVLVVIDDVDHEDQIDALLPHETVLESDSIILITSRNKDVLKYSGVHESSIYDLTGLTAQHSLELFCLHSFKQRHPFPEFEYLVEKFLEACGGLPLSLKVFGALLHEKNTRYWEDQLNKLQRILPREIKQRLQISYDALDMEEQHIFLDIACFFIGKDRDMVIRIWDGGFCGFQNIQNKCLVEVNSNNEIKMHDHLRDMGREIAKDSGLPRRIWRWTESTSHDLLQHSSNGKVNVRGIRMATSDYNDYIDDEDDDIPMMVGLQLVDTEGVLLERILTKAQRPNLIWLRWNDCPLSSLTSSISMKKLRVLEVQGYKLKTLWETEFQAPLQLRELVVKASLSSIPESIGQLKHLERIVLKSYHNSNLTKLPEEFCLLQSLKTLVLHSCEEMESLPESFGNLTNLRHINLTSCNKLVTLPDSFGNLTNLRHFNLLGGDKMATLPSSFGNLTNLRHIDLCGCSQLVTLPDSFGNLTNLRHINLPWCKKLVTLPSSFGSLTNLRHINLFGCSKMATLPSSFGKLIKLQYLELGDCSNLSMSSETLGNISTLEYLNLSNCYKIKALPLQVVHQGSLEQLIFRLTNIKIKELPSAIGELSNLQVLEIEVPLLDTLPPSLCGLMNLTKLDLYGCKRLKCLPFLLGELRNLKQLIIQGCKELKCLPVSIRQLSKLTELQIVSCPLIRELPFIKDVKGERQTLSDLQSSIDNCILPRLQRLVVCKTNISEVSFAEGVCCSLFELVVSYCDNMVEVGILPDTLVYLSVLMCLNLRKIDNTNALAKLQKLNITGCRELEELPRIEELASLRELVAGGCKKLKSIRGLGQLANLGYLDIRGCSELEELEGIQHCMSLKSLSVSGCPKLQWTAGVVDQLRQRFTGNFYDKDIVDDGGDDVDIDIDSNDTDSDDDDDDNNASSNVDDDGPLKKKSKLDP